MGLDARVKSLFDTETAKKEQKEFLKLLEETGEAITRLNGSIDPKKLSQTFSGARDGMQKYNEESAKMAKMQEQILAQSQKLQELEKKLAKERENGAKAQKSQTEETSRTEKAKERLAQTIGKEAKEVALLNAQTQENNKQLKLRAQLENAVAGSIEEAKLKVRSLIQQRDVLNLSTEAGKKKQAELNAEIDRYNSFIDTNSSKLERQKINIGNYSGALTTLEKSLEEVVQKMDDMKNSGEENSDVYKNLQKEYTLLEGIVTNQANGFVSMSEEIKNNQVAIEQLIAIRGAEDATVRDLIQQNAELRDSYADLIATQRTLGSDTFAFDALLQGGQALIGIYSAAQGASALFGEENKDLQKVMVKLQASMALVQGVQAAVNALQKEGALIQGLMAVKTTATSLAMKAYAFATGGATVAARAFNTALLAGGIGIALTLIATAASAMGAFGDETDKATESLRDFNAELEFSKQVLDELYSNLDHENAILIEKLKQRGASEKEILNQTVTGLEKKREANKIELQILQEKYDAVSVKDKDYAENKRKIADAILEREKQDLKFEQQIEMEREQFKTRQAQESRNKAKKDADDRLQRSKEYAVKERKAQFDILKQAAQDRIDAQKAIAEAEGPTASVRSQARLNQLAEEKALATAEKEFLLKNDKLTASERELIQINHLKKLLELETRAATDIIAIRKSVNDSIKEASEETEAALSADADKKMNDKIDFYTQWSLKEIQQIETSTNKKLAVLNNEFAAGKISKEKYEEEKIKIEDAALKKSLQSQIDYYKSLISLYEFDEDKKKEALARLAEVEKQLSEVGVKSFTEAGDKEKSLHEKRIRNLEEYAAKAQEVFGIVSGFFTDAIDRQKNALQEKSDEIDKNYEKEVENITNSTLTEEQKANRLKILEVEKQAQKEQIERKQRQLDVERAKFEKAANISRIMTEGALAVVHQLGSGDPFTATARAIAVGIISAAQLARAIAAPLPKFYTGTEYSPEGFAETDEHGPELYIRPNKEMFMGNNTPTIRYLEKGTKIIPHDKVDDFLLKNMMKQTGREIIRTDAGGDHTSKKLDQMMKSNQEWIMWQTTQLKEAYKNSKQPINITINDFKNSDYIRKAVKE